MSRRPAGKRETRADLSRRIRELEAQLAYTYHIASSTLHKAGQDRMMASGVLLTLNALGGAEIIPPVVIRDGLSAETIAAIRADIARSFDLATQFKPKA